MTNSAILHVKLRLVADGLLIVIGFYFDTTMLSLCLLLIHTEVKWPTPDRKHTSKNGNMVKLCTSDYYNFHRFRERFSHGVAIRRYIHVDAQLSISNIWLIVDMLKPYWRLKWYIYRELVCLGGFVWGMTCLRGHVFKENDSCEHVPFDILWVITLISYEREASYITVN